MSAPDRIWAVFEPHESGRGHPRTYATCEPTRGTEYLRADGPTITAYREALRLLGVDPDSIAREAEKEAQNG